MNFRKSRVRSHKNSFNIMVNSEKWRSCSRKLSRLDKELEEESEDDVPKTTDLKEWLEELFLQRKTGTSDEDEVNLTKKQTLILSTLVPDEILMMNNFNAVDTKRFVGVLMMADVSGFTALSEKYNNMGKTGIYKLTVTLNTYLGSLVEVIYSHGGDIIKFAGDAFLALWKTDKRTFLSHTIHTAIACALIIQHSYGSYETDVKVDLKVKLAISAGNLVFAPIGSGIDMNYIIVGLPVLEAKIAESLCTSGEVKLTPTAWGHCYSRNYDHIISENRHVTIKAILYDPHEKDVTKPFLGFAAMIRQVNKTFISLENLTDFLLDDSKNLSESAILKRNEWLSLRRTILIAEEKNIGAEIRKFMIRPVLTQIDAHQPLEYLTEMRQVSVLFITLKPRDCPLQQLITIVNNSYQITCDIVYKSLGCVNKIILFDKDIMILVIFGLRGFKHESEAQAALKCAYSVKKSVSALDGVLEVSIGVTTGQVYCGVVGHPLRREFTVIGAVVNKAARFMCNFRNKITCDEETYIKSKMSSNGFILQSPTQLKGIVQPGKIFEYTEEIRTKVLFDIPLMLPLLNRDDEMQCFKNWLTNRSSTGGSFDSLLFIGESRIGKSRLLEWMARFTKNNDLKVCFLPLTSIHCATPYLALSQIIEKILDIKETVNSFEKEERIVKLLNFYSEDLCYLNNIIKVRFAYHESFSSQSESIRLEKTRNIFKKLIDSICETHVIFLDDLQNLDSLSWEFISIIIKSMKMFVVMTVTKGKFSSMHNWLYMVLMNNNIRKFGLGPLNTHWIAPLACQILDVHAVSSELSDALKLKCNGIPGLIETFIVHLFSNGALEIRIIAKSELEKHEDVKLQFPDSSLLQPVAMETKDQMALTELLQENVTDNISVCLVKEKDQLNIDVNVQNVDALIMMQMDSLTPYQQLLLKIASVIGNVLSRDLLENIMYENNSLSTAKAIKRFFAMRILCCANTRHSKSSITTVISNYSESVNLSCECLFDYEPEANDNLPKYAYCKIMKFKSRNSRKTFYGLLPLNQKKEFHSRIVNYLENNKQKCPECGGGLIVIQSKFNFQPQVSTSTNYNEDSIKFDSQIVFKELIDKQSKCSNDLEDSVLARKTKSESLSASSNNNVKTNSDINIRKYSDKKTSQFTPILKIKSYEADDDDMRRRSTKRVTMTDVILKNFSSKVLNKSTVFDKFRNIIEAKNIEEWHDIGVTDSEDYLKVNKPRRSINITLEKGISQINFTRCSCAQLNIIIYDQLIRHAKAAEMNTKMIDFLLHFCYLNILENNFDIAIAKLEEAETNCIEKAETNKNNLDIIRFLGKVYSLKAASLLLSGRLTAAKLNIENAAKIYQINLKKNSKIFSLPKIYMALKYKGKKYNVHNKLMKKDCIFFLNVATILYSAIDDEKTSRIAALRSVFLVQKVESNIIDICDSFTNAIQLNLDRQTQESTVGLENMAYKCLENIHKPIRADELFAVGKLLLTIFRARIARSHFAPTIRSGFRALVISRFLGAETISIDIIPDLFYLLLSRYRIEEAVDVVRLLLTIGETPTSLDCETWYYALCMDMILDAGFQLECPYEISRFAEFSIIKGKAAGEGRRRLILGLWTYWLRTDSEGKARRYETESLNWLVSNTDGGSMKSVISGMRLAEGMLESLAKKIEDLRKVVDLMELRSLADQELSKLERDIHLIRVIYPRWLLLKANSLSLSGRQAAASVVVNQALEEARKINNHLEEALALAITSKSEIWLQNALTGNFPYWNANSKSTRNSWHKSLYKIAI